MYLEKFKQALKKTDAVCAKEFGIPISTFHRWRSGRRKPGDDFMKKIFLWSKGAVEPNDFYPMDEWRKELEADTQN